VTSVRRGSPASLRSHGRFQGQQWPGDLERAGDLGILGAGPGDEECFGGRSPLFRAVQRAGHSCSGTADIPSGELDSGPALGWGERPPGRILAHRSELLADSKVSPGWTVPLL
jgi:hypothetical protein